MVSPIRIPIAAGVSIILFDGWNLEAVGQLSECAEISLGKADTQACLRLVALGTWPQESGYHQFRFSLMESLVSLDCTISPIDKESKNLITAVNPAKSGEIVHYLRQANPLIHMSAAGIITAEQKKELVSMADSVILDDSESIRSKELVFGQIIPFRLNRDLWIP